MTGIQLVTTHPNPNKNAGELERGRAHVFIKDLGMDLRGIFYVINADKTVSCTLPYNKDSSQKEDGVEKSDSFPYITFRNNTIKKEIEQLLIKNVVAHLDVAKHKK